MTLIALAALLVGGCRTPDYRAANLPAELHVAPSDTSNDINLARMVGPGTGTNQVSPGDLVEVTVASGRNDEKVVPMQLRVSRDGAVNVAPIGPVKVTGLEPVAAEQQIVEAAIERGIFVRPTVTLQVITPAVNRITVLGAVQRPGVVELPKGSSDVARALAAAEGLTEEAGTQIDILRQTAPTQLVGGHGSEVSNQLDEVTLASFDAAKAASASATSANSNVFGPASALQSVRIDLTQAETTDRSHYALNDRDVVMVLPNEPRFVHVTGLVQKAGQFEIPTNQDIRVLDAIALAGGPSSPVADKVFVIRQSDDSPEPVVIQVSIADAERNGNENLRLGPGDLISIERTPSTVVTDTFITMFRVGFSVGGNLVAF